MVGLAQTDIRYVAFVQLGTLTGLRVSDLLKLKYSDFESEVLEIVETKTTKAKRIEITDSINSVIANLRSMQFHHTSDYLFYGRTTDKPMHRSSIYRALRKHAEYAGLKGVGCHSLRKTFAINVFIESGYDLEFTRTQLNHKYSATTLIHYLFSSLKNLDPELLQKVLMEMRV